MSCFKSVLAAFLLALLLGSRACGQAPSTATAPDRSVVAVLRQKADFVLKDGSLDNVVERLRTEFRVGIIVDSSVRSVAAPRTINCELRETTIATALDVMLPMLGLDWFARKDSLLITTEAKASTIVSTEYYNVTDLMESSSDRGPGRPIGDVNRQTPLLSVLNTAVKIPNLDGLAQQELNIHWFKGGTAVLIARQPQRVQRRIHEHLKKLRSTVGTDGVVPNSDGGVTIVYRVAQSSEMQESDLQQERFAQLLADTILKSVALIQGAAVEDESARQSMIEFATSYSSSTESSFSTVLASVLTKHVARKSWSTNGGAGEVEAIPGALIVSQTAQVHKTVSRFLAPFLLDRASPVSAWADETDSINGIPEFLPSMYFFPNDEAPGPVPPEEIAPAPRAPEAAPAPAVEKNPRAPNPGFRSP